MHRREGTVPGGCSVAVSASEFTLPRLPGAPGHGLISDPLIDEALTVRKIYTDSEYRRGTENHDKITSETCGASHCKSNSHYAETKTEL